MNATPTTSDAAQPAAQEQLSLLSPSAMPLQFRLSRATRERGLAHIAAIRKQLARSGRGKAA
jgi:hypothetical protein